MKRIFLFLLIVVMVLTNASITGFAKYEIIAANLSDLSIIKKTGLPASEIYTKTGDFTMKFSGEDIYRNIKIPCKSDWSGNNLMEMWYYSPNEVSSEIFIALISDDKATSGLDYYVASFRTGIPGWNLVSIPYESGYSEFRTVNNPKGIDKIDRMEIWTQYEGENPDSNLVCYFDKIVLRCVDMEEYLQLKKEDNTTETQKEVVAFSAFSLGSTNKSVSPVTTDWTPYNTLKITANSENASGRSWWMVVRSENPDTSGADYYYTDFKADWEGDATFEFDMRDGGSFCRAGKPLGWNKITGLEFWTYVTEHDAENGTFNNEQTAVVVEKMTLSNKDWTQIINPENGNYTIATKLEKDFTDYASLMKSNYSGENAHPRLLFDQTRLEQIREWVKTDDYMKKSYAKLIETCEEQLKTGIVTKPTPSESMRLVPVAFAYNLTGDQRYADWIWESMKVITNNYGAWNPGNADYLSVGDTMRAVSYTYDWMYNHWTEEQRTIVRNALVHFGMEPTLRFARTYFHFAGTDGGNWGQIVMSGFALTGLAIAGDDTAYDDMVNETINRAVRALTYMHPKTISPEGDYVEGVGYWSYGMGNYIPFLAAMHRSIGTTGGLMDLPGMSVCADFPIGSTGPMGYYNFADTSGGGVITTGGYFFLSEYFNNPTYGAFQINYTKNGGTWEAMALYSPRDEYSNYTKYMPKYTHIPGNNDVVTIRKSWIDNNAAYLGAKAGASTTWHDHLDAGSFIYDNLGVRWAIELGRDDYDHLNYYEDGKYAFYRNRAEGQNTLVINPNGKLDQNKGAEYATKIEKIEVNDSAGYVVMDLTKAYEGRGVSSVKRGFAMLNNFGSLLLRDEITSSKPVEVYSFIHTQAEIEVAPDGKSAVLSQNGQKLRVRLLDNSSGKLVSMAADPLPSSPNPKEAFPRNGIRKLAVHVENVKNPVINVLLTPYFEDEEYEFSLNSVLPLRSWKNYLKNTVSIDNIYVDGVPITQFEKTVSSYVLNEYEVSHITCDAPKGVDVTIKQAEKLGDTAFIVAKTNTSKAVYTVSFANQIQNLMEVSSYIPVRIYADLGDSLAGRIMDSDTVTDWSVSEPAAIYFDLGKPKLLKELKAMWYKGSQRIAYFTISVSDDGENWKTVFDGESLLTDDFETYSFAPVTARYIKLYGKGNTSNNYVSINEVRITAYEDAFNDVSTHWAKGDIQNLVNVGVLAQTDDGAFHPDSSISRGEFIDLVQKTSKFAKAAYSGTFKDVSETSLYCGSIEGAYAAGIIPAEMIENGSFMPDKPITCEEMLAVSALACNYSTGNEAFYASLDTYEYRELISQWCIKHMQNAIALRLTGGSLAENGGLVPTANATRAQAAVIAKRIYIKTY